MIIAEHGYTPTATRKVPPYRTCSTLAARSMMYPAMAIMQPPAMMGPRALILSDSSEVRRTTTNAAMLGGTVNNWAVVVFEYPNPVMIVGRKREKLCASGISELELLAKGKKTHVEGNEDKKPDQGRQPQLRGFEGHFDPPPIEMLLVDIFGVCGAMRVLLHAGHCNYTLFFGQKARISWRVWHEEEAYDPEDHGHDALNCTAMQVSIAFNNFGPSISDSLKKIQGQRLYPLYLIVAKPVANKPPNAPDKGAAQ